MWISFAVTPISVAFGESLDDCATAGAMPSVATAVAAHADQQDPTLAEHPCLPLSPGGVPSGAYCIHTVRTGGVVPAAAA